VPQQHLVNLPGAPMLTVAQSSWPSDDTWINSDPTGDANPSVAALYSSLASNIFLQLHSQPLPEPPSFFNPSLINPTLTSTSISGDEETTQQEDCNPSLLFQTQISPPDDMHIQPEDSTHLSYFLKKGPTFLGSPCFTPELIDILTLSLTQPLLRHGILALSTSIRFTETGPSPRCRKYMTQNLNHIVPHLQSAITLFQFGRVHLVCVVFLVYHALAFDDIVKAHRHLRGFYAMLRKLQYFSQEGNLLLHPQDPLILFLYMVALKADTILGDRHLDYIFPSIVFEEDYFSNWLSKTSRSKLNYQISMASIQLTFLANEIGHLRRDAIRLRRLKLSETTLRERVDKCQLHLDNWLDRQPIKQHLAANSTSPHVPRTKAFHTEKGCFLDYPEYVLFDVKVARMHLLHTSFQIQLCLIRDTCVTASTFDKAILACRIFAALKEGVDTNNVQMMGLFTLIPLWIAGLVFADRKRYFRDGMASSFLPVFVFRC
jgi:hypothetical protein